MRNQKGYITLVLIFIVIVAAVLGYYLYSNMFSTSSSQTSLNPQTPSTETSNWKTYTKSNNWEVKYPSSYILEETSKTPQTLEGIYLKKETEYVVGGGQGGSDVLSKGVIISFTIIPNKKISELTFGQGSNPDLREINVNQTIAKEIISNPKDEDSRYIYLQLSNDVLKINLGIGFDTNAENKIIYRKEFNGIIATFKILDQSADTTSWKTYNNYKYKFSLQYPNSLDIKESETGISLSNYERLINSSQGVSGRDYTNIGVSIYNLPPNIDFKQWIIQQTVRLLPDNTKRSSIQGDISPYDSNGLTGYMFESGSEEVDKNIVISSNEHIAWFTLIGYQSGGSYKENPNSEKILNQILSTFKITD